MSGWILAAGPGYNVALEAVSPSSGRTRAVIRNANGAIAAAQWAAPGSVAYALVPEATGPRPSVRLNRVEAGGRIEGLGPPISSVRTAEAGGGLIVVATCHRVLVTSTSTSAEGRWHSVGTGCAAAPSADGRFVVYATREGSIWQVSAAGSEPPHRLLTLTDRSAGLDTLGSHVTVTALALADPGLAILVQGSGAMSDRYAIVVRRPSGSVVVATTGALGGSVLPTLEWQPHGTLLAFNSPLAGGGAVRVFDPSTATGRIVAVDPQGFSSLRWSPSGSAIAASGSRSDWLLVDLNGDWIRRLGSGGSNHIYDWSA